jgi:hypothetical protein
MDRIIGIDPGESCGMVVLDGGQITSVLNIMFDNVGDKITKFLIHPNCIVVVEDIRPYSLRLTPQVIWTCKFIGELTYRLKAEAGANVEMMVRNEVKKWCFDTFPDICIPIIEKKILKKGYGNKETGEPRKPSFVFVDDKIVTDCMKVMYKIQKPKSGFGYIHGLKDHSWQALAIASCWWVKTGKTLL